MAKEIIYKTSTDLSDSEFDALTPLTSRALFWRANYMAPSPVLDQLPFIFWLVENTRPTVTVTLGVADPVAHFAVCQAVEKLGLETMCFGIEPPQETAADLRSVLDYNERHYCDFSQIVQMDHTGAAETLLETGIDLLLVNQPANQALLDEIDHYWLPRLSERGVILFTQGGTEIGYRAYIQRISHDNGFFTLNPAGGVCVVLRGAQQNDRLQRLAQLKIGKPGYLSIRNVFARLGELHSKANLLERKSREASKNRSMLDQKIIEITAHKKQFSEIQGKATKLNDRLQAGATEIATTQVEIFELTQKADAQAKTIEERDNALKAAKEQAGDWQQKAGELTRKTQTQTAELDDLKARLEAAGQDNNRLQKTLTEQEASLAERFQNIAALGLEIDATAKKRETLSQECDTARQTVQIQTAELKELKYHLEAAGQDNNRLQKTLTEQEASLAERFQDIAALGLEINTTAKQHESLSQERDTARQTAQTAQTAQTQTAQTQSAEFEKLKLRFAAAGQENSRLQKNLTKQEASLAERFKDIATLGLEIDTTVKQRNALSQEIETLVQERETLTEERDLAHQDTEIQSGELQNLLTRLDEIDRQHTERDERVTALETSTSWRVTSPLRQISSTFRKP